MSHHNIVSVSGGKDSTATLLLAIILETPNLQAVFADTGNEHDQTYEYLYYLEQSTQTKITRVRADFTNRIAGKRSFIETKWREQVVMPLMGQGDMILSWQGVRADESINRRHLPECDEVGGGLFNYRPILKWDVPAVFEAHRYMGIKPNPLYSQGMGRVGCMPCINCRKDELREIALRFPEVIDRIDHWERIVQQASKRGAATFFAGSNAKHTKGSISGMTALEVMEIASIRQAVEWSKTARGGIQYDLMIATDATACSSAYGLCESDWEPATIMEAA